MRSSTEIDQRNAVEFTDRDLELIKRALPQNSDQRRLALLPDIIRDWGRIDLPKCFGLGPIRSRYERSAIGD